MKIRIIIPEPPQVKCDNCERYSPTVARFCKDGRLSYVFHFQREREMPYIDLCERCLEQGLSELRGA